MTPEPKRERDYAPTPEEIERAKARMMRDPVRRTSESPDPASCPTGDATASARTAIWM
jgi:hypothetical protein